MSDIISLFLSSLADSPILVAIWDVYKACALVVSGLSILGIIMVVVKSRQYSETSNVIGAVMEAGRLNTQVSSVQKPTAYDDWERITNRLTSEDQKNYLKSILEADALVDYALKVQGFPGESMGERMQAIRPEQLPSLEDLWRAHKVRNELAHDPNRPLSESEGALMMRIYERVLTDLRAI